MSRTVPDLRPRMTRRAVRFLEDGAPLLVAGGPLSGRSTMLGHLAVSLPGFRFHDDILPEELADLIGSGSRGWGASIDLARLYRLGSVPGIRVLPLVNLAPADLRRACEWNGIDSRDLFEWSAGHPYLVSHYPAPEARSTLEVRIGDALAGIPEALDTYGMLHALGAECTPADRYTGARRAFGSRCKERLNLLAALGVITRFIEHEHAGVVLLPLGPDFPA